MTKKISFIAALAIALSPMGRVFAAPGVTVVTWDGGSGANSNWNTGLNWVSDAAPTAGSALTFTGSTRRDAYNNFTATTSFAGIAFDSGAGIFTIQGNALALTGRGEDTLTGQWAVLDNSTVDQNISNNLTLDGSLTIEKNSDTGTLNITGDIVNDGNQTLTVTDGQLHGVGGNVAISGVISGSGALAKTGAEGSILYLAGANTYTGETIISNSGYGSGPGANNGGIINITNASALGTTAGGTTVEIGAALEIQNNIAVGAEALTLSGNGVDSGGALRNISGNNSWAGQITLDHAAMINSDSGLLTLTGGITGAHDLALGGAGNITVSSTIATGAGSLTKDGSGTLTLTGYNTYTGSTTINAGTVSISSIKNIGAGASALGAPELVSKGTIALGAATLQYTGTGDTTDRVINLSSITGTSTLVQSGTGILNFTGGVISTGAGSKTLLLTGSTAGSGKISGVISDNSSINKTSIRKEGTGAWTLAGANTYTGATTVSSGTLILDTNLTASSALNFDSAGATGGHGGSVVLGEGHTITAGIRNTSGSNGVGNLDFEGNGTVNGNIGASGAALYTVNATGVAGTTVTINGEVYAADMTVGAGTLDLDGTFHSVGASTLKFLADGFVILEDTHTIEHNITTDHNGEGTLSFKGDGEVTGTIGASGAYLKAINVVQNDNSVDLNKAVYVNTLAFGPETADGDTTVTFGGDAHIGQGGAGQGITTQWPYFGIVAFNGDATVNGDIGVSTAAIWEIYLNTTGKTLNLQGNTFVDDGIYLSSASQTINIAAGKNVTADLYNDSGSNGEGTLIFLGSSTYNGGIGDSDDSLADINITGVAGTTVTINGNIYSDDVTVGSGNLLLNGNLTSNDAKTLIYDNDGYVTLADGHTINSNITTDADNQGTLSFQGKGTVNGNIGEVSSALKDVNLLGAAGSSVTVNGDLYAQDVSIGGGQLLMNGNLTSVLYDTVNFSQPGGELILAAGHAINSNITTSNNGGGTLTFQSSGTVRGDIGAASLYIKEINAAQSGSSVTLNGDVYANALHFTGAGNGTKVEFVGDAGIGQGGTGHGITTVNDGNGIVLFDHNATVNGNTGAEGASLGLIQLGGDQATFNGDTYTKGFAFVGAPAGSSVTFNGGAYIGVSSITTGINHRGIVNFNANAVVAGQIGSAGHALLEINAMGVAGTTVTIHGDVYAYDMTVGTGTIDLDGTFHSVAAPTTLKFLADGKVILEDGHAIEHNVTTDNDGQGTLDFMGEGTVDGNIGSLTRSLKAINVAQEGNTVNLIGEVYANSLNFGNGDAGTTVTISSYAYIGQGTAAITTASDSFGTVVFSSNTLIDGQIGADGLALNEVSFQGDATTTATVNGDIYSDDVTVGAGNLLLNGSLSSRTAKTLSFTDDGTVTVTDGHDINSNIDTDNDEEGALVFKGTSTVTGDIGHVSYALKGVKIGDGETAGGLVIINGDITANNTTVDSGATLKLTEDRAITGSLSLLDTLAAGKGGTLDLQGSTLTLVGGFTQASADATLITRILHSDTYGNIAQTGAANITAGKLDITVDGYVRNNTTFTIVNADDGTGVDASALAITHNSGILSFTGVGSGTQDLEVLATRVNTYDTFAGNTGAAAAGAALESAGNTAVGDMLAILDLLDNMSGADLAKALDTLVPDTNGSTMEVTKLTLGQFTGAITAHQEALRTGVATGSNMKNGLGVWTQSYGSYLTQSQRELSNGYKATVWGTAFGLDLPLSDSFSAGIGYGLTRGTVRGKDNSNRNAIDSSQWTLYGGYAGDAFYLDLSGSYSRNTYDASRRIVVGPEIRTASADYAGQQYSGFVEAGYTLNHDKVRVTPLVSMQYQRLSLNEYTETGADSLDLTVKARDYYFAQTGAGLKFGGPISTKLGKLVPELRAVSLYDWTTSSQKLTSVFNGGGSAFDSTGFDPARLSWDFGAKLTLFAKHDITVSLNYDVEIKQDFHAQNGYVNAKYRF